MNQLYYYRLSVFNDVYIYALKDVTETLSEATQFGISVVRIHGSIFYGLEISGIGFNTVIYLVNTIGMQSSLCRNTCE